MLVGNLMLRDDMQRQTDRRVECRRHRKAGMLRAWRQVARRRATLWRRAKLAGFRLYRWRAANLQQAFSNWGILVHRKMRRKQVLIRLQGELPFCCSSCPPLFAMLFLTVVDSQKCVEAAFGAVFVVAH